MTALVSGHKTARPQTLPLESSLLLTHGNTALSVSLRMKLKLAPRSSLQFKVGPQFTPTTTLRTVLTANGRLLIPTICPRIDRGFELVETNWVGYKRNYFTLVSTFVFLGVPFHTFANEKYSMIDEYTNNVMRIKYFALRLVSRNHDDNLPISLVQHTAKRDRGPQFSPSDQVVVPGDLPLHTIIKESANVRNGGKIAKLDKIFFFDKDSHDSREFGISGLKQYPSSKISKVARFERVQFTSSINFKKACPNPRRFVLVVELIAFTEDDEAVPVAYTQTPPLIIRGRSPSSYRCTLELSSYEIERMKTDMAGILLESYEGGPLTQSYPDILEDLLTYEILKEANNALSGKETQKKTKKIKSKKARQQDRDTNISITTPKSKRDKQGGPKIIKPKKLLLGPKPKAPKKKKEKKKKEKRKKPNTEPVSEFAMKDVDAIFNTDFVNSPSAVGFHFHTPWANTEVASYQPLTPMTAPPGKENIFKIDYTVKLTQQQPQTPGVSIKTTENVEDLENDFDNLSFNTSFGIAKLFDDVDLPIPTFKKEPDKRKKRSLVSTLEIDNELNFDQELDLLKCKRLHLSPLKRNALNGASPGAMEEADDQCVLPSALVDFGAFDEFPSFSLWFDQH